MAESSTSSSSEAVNWDAVLNASSDEEDFTWEEADATQWQKGFWWQYPVEEDTPSGGTDMTDGAPDVTDSPLLVQGIGILTSLESAVPDGRNILHDDDLPSDPLKSKTFYVAREVMTTERSFLKGIHLVEKAFHGSIKMHNRTVKEILPESAQRTIFSNIAAIYELSVELLVQLEKRIDKWEENPQISDIFVKRAPFFKMYSRYSADFEQSQAALSQWLKKSSQLREIANTIESNRLCCGLTIPTYMLYPIQRVPRYRLLLQAYLKTLKEGDLDYENTTKALELMGAAAMHMENQMVKLANFQQVVKIQGSLCGKGAKGLVQPGREFLLKAAAKQAKRRGGVKNRVLFLFSDILLIAQPGKRFGSGYKINSTLQLTEVTVGTLQSRHLEASHTFSLNVANKTYYFSMSTEEEKKIWKKCINEASNIEVAKRNTFLLEYSRSSASHLSVLLSDPDIQGQLQQYAQERAHTPEEPQAPSLQDKLRTKLAAVRGTCYSPSTVRKLDAGSKPLVELISQPTHIGGAGFADQSITSKRATPLQSHSKVEQGLTADAGGDEVDGGDDEVDWATPMAILDARPSVAEDEVDFMETLLSPFSTYIWVKRASEAGSSWKQLWCELCGLWIYCFEDHQMSRKPSGCIPLAGYRMVDSQVEFSFGLEHPVKPAFLLKFDNQHDHKRWYSIIRRDLHKYLLEEAFALQL